MERWVTRGMKVTLEPVGQPDRLDKPLFAINWFDTRSRLIYDLYNALASRSLFKVGGKVLFKGRVIETLSGRALDARQILLIVNYPSGERFLDLLSGTFFQIVSALRILAVRRFSFGLNERIDGPQLLGSATTPFARGPAWAIHHYASDQDIRENLEALREFASSSGLELWFVSQKIGTVTSETGAGSRQPMDSVTDKVVLFKAATAQQLRDGLLSPRGQQLVNTQPNSYVGLLDRVL